LGGWAVLRGSGASLVCGHVKVQFEDKKVRGNVLERGSVSGKLREHQEAKCGFSDMN
jgi:hypothetical protein